MYCATCSGAAWFSPPLSGTPPPPLPSTPRFMSTYRQISSARVTPSSLSSHFPETSTCFFPCGRWPPRSPIRRAALPAQRLKKRSRTPAASPPTCWIFASSFSIPPLPRKSSLPHPASRSLPPRSPVPGIGRRSPYTGGAHRRWEPWCWPTYTPPLLITVTSNPPPRLHCAVHWCVPFRALHGTIMSHRGHRGWGRFTS